MFLLHEYFYHMNIEYDINIELISVAITLGLDLINVQQRHWR